MPSDGYVMHEDGFKIEMININWFIDAWYNITFIHLKLCEVPEAAWSSCGSSNQCFLDAMQQSTDTVNPGICTTDAEAMADTDGSITSDCACDR